MRYIYIFFIVTLFSCNENKSISNLVSANDFNQMISNDKSAIIIDVRTPEEFNKGHLRNSLNVNWFDENFDENLKIFNKDLPVLVYCLSGGRSSKANEKIQSLGFKNVYELDGGILEWRKNKLPEALLNNNYENSLTVDDFNVFIETDKIVLVDYYANWCAPCKIMEPYLDEISNEYSDHILTMNEDLTWNGSVWCITKEIIFNTKDFYNIQPDILIASKCITSGFFPLGAVILGEKMTQEMMEASYKAEEFYHGFTAGGHPVGCALALEAIDILSLIHI